MVPFNVSVFFSRFLFVFVVSFCWHFGDILTIFIFGAVRCFLNHFFFFLTAVCFLFLFFSILRSWLLAKQILYQFLNVAMRGCDVVISRSSGSCQRHGSSNWWNCPNCQGRAVRSCVAKCFFFAKKRSFWSHVFCRNWCLTHFICCIHQYYHISKKSKTSFFSNIFRAPNKNRELHCEFSKPPVQRLLWLFGWTVVSVVVQRHT